MGLLLTGSISGVNIAKFERSAFWNCYITNMKQRIYIDTSIVGGFFDKEFEEPTKALFEKRLRYA